MSMHSRKPQVHGLPVLSGPVVVDVAVVGALSLPPSVALPGALVTDPDWLPLVVDVVDVAAAWVSSPGLVLLARQPRVRAPSRLVTTDCARGIAVPPVWVRALRFRERSPESSPELLT
jgi:hypothetical protein